MKPSVYKKPNICDVMKPTFHKRFLEMLRGRDADGTPNEAALRDQLGYSTQRLHSYYNKEKFPEPSFLSVAAMAEVLDYSLDYLSGISDSKNSRFDSDNDCEFSHLRDHKLISIFKNLKGFWRRKNQDFFRVDRRFIVPDSEPYKARYPGTPLPGIFESTGPYLQAEDFLKYLESSGSDNFSELLRSILCYVQFCCKEDYFKKYLSEEKSSLEQNPALKDYHIPSITGNDTQAELISQLKASRLSEIHKNLDSLVSGYAQEEISSWSETARENAEDSIDSAAALILDKENILDNFSDCCEPGAVVPDTGYMSFDSDEMYNQYLFESEIPQSFG